MGSWVRYILPEPRATRSSPPWAARFGKIFVGNPHKEVPLSWSGVITVATPVQAEGSCKVDSNDYCPM